MTRLDNDLISRKDLLEAMKALSQSKDRVPEEDFYNLVTNAPTIEADSGEAVGVIKSESRLEDGAELHYAYLFKHLPIGTKLFTSPPKRYWRDLSVNEHSRLIWENTKLNQNLKDDLDTFSFVLNTTKAIEAKLKELNHDTKR